MTQFKVNFDLKEEKIYSIRNYWSWMNFFVVLLSVLILFAVARNHIFMCVQVSGRSMYPTVQNNDYLLVMKSAIEYRRGDVVIFYSQSLNKLLIKRVIAIPGDEVCTIDGDVYLKKSGRTVFERVDEYYLDIKHSTWRTSYAYGRDLPETKIEDGEVFVMGDNRTDSLDSRVLGAVPIEDVKGVVSQFVIDNRNWLQFVYRMF